MLATVDRPGAAQELLRRRQARRGLLEFTRYTKTDYETSWHHKLLCDHLDRFAFGDLKRLIVNMPPRHGKSELASRRLPAYVLGRNPSCRIIACSHTASLAGDLNRDVQRVIESDPYRRLFPGSSLSAGNVRTVAGAPLRNSETFEIVGHTGHYRAAGVGGNIVGRGFDIGIIDDPIKSREEADSPTIRAKIWSWYTGDFLTRREPNSRILIIMTRWHEDDLVGRLLRMQVDDERADKWTVLRLPALREEVDNTVDPRQVGEALWPSRYPPEELKKTQAINPYEWGSQYQQDPRPPGSAEWPGEFFGPHIWFDDFPACPWVARVLALDPSKGKADKSGDYSAFIDLRVDADWTLWVDADLDQTRPVEPLASSPDRRSIIEDGVALYRAINPDAFIIETNGFQEMIAGAFARVSRERNLGLKLWKVDNTVNKQARIRTLGPYLAQRRMRIRNTKGGRILVQQMRDFPAGEHDDGPDALKTAEMMADKLVHSNANSQVELLRT